MHEIIKNATQAQREAILDTLILSLYIDGKIRFEENDTLDEMITILDDGADTSLGNYLNQSIANIRDIWNNTEKVTAKLDSISERLLTQDLREATLNLVEKLTASDHEVASQESEFFELLSKTFQN